MGDERPTRAILWPHVSSYFRPRDALGRALKFGEPEPYGPRSFPCPAQSLPRPESFTIVSIAQRSHRARMQRTACQLPLGASIVDRRQMDVWCSNGAVPDVQDATRKRRIPPSAAVCSADRRLCRSDHAAHETKAEHTEHHGGDALHVARIDHAAQAIAQKDG